MAKRFIDTSIFKKGFIRSLKTEHKLFWIYLINDCDHAGIWIKDLEIASLYLGVQLKESEILSCFSDKIIEIDKGEKWLIPSFIEFQYGNLYRNNKAHYSVIKIIEKYDLTSIFSIDDSKPEDFLMLRKRLTTSAKNIILARDHHRCQYCGCTDIDLLNVDHIISLKNGGNNQNYNLITSCVSCNSKKSDKDVYEFIKKNDIKLLEGASNLIEGAYNNLLASMDKDKEKEKEKEEGVAVVATFRTDVQKPFNWGIEVGRFLNDSRWRENFCMSKGIKDKDLFKSMKEFTTKLTLQEDFKDCGGLKKHYVNHYNKYGLVVSKVDTIGTKEQPKISL